MKSLALLLLAIFSPLSLPAADSLYLELSGRGEKTDLGLVELAPGKNMPPNTAAEFRATLKNDLEFTRLFRFIEGGPAGDGKKFKTAEWSRLGADVVAGGRLEPGLAGAGKFSGVLIDANTGQTVLAKDFFLDDGARRAAHKWADEIVRYFTGQPGVASTRIVFANDATGHKEICMVDYDGTNFRRLTEDRSIALFPKLSPDGNWITYTTFRENMPAVYMMRSDGREKRALCRYPGLNDAASWLPDGKSLVATLSLGREPNLHRVDLNGKILETLTRSAGADTAPTLSPDGLRLAFTSDRAGSPQIYVMDLNGGNLRRLSTGGQCDSPHWSPLGHLILFTMSTKGNFDLYSLEVATGKQTRLTFGEGDNENGSWSPDGRHIVFTSTRRGRPELHVMNADGSNPTPLGPIPGRSFSPHWGN